MVNQSKTQPITLELLHAKPLSELRKAYHTLSALENGDKLTRQQLEDYIYKKLNPELFTTKVKNNMTENKTYTPKEIAKEKGISPTALRKLLRKNFKKPAEGNWKLSTDDVEKLLKLYKEDRERAAESKSHNIERLKAAREAKKAAQAKAATTTKTSTAKAAPAKKAPAKAAK